MPNSHFENSDGNLNTEAFHEAKVNLICPRLKDKDAVIGKTRNKMLWRDLRNKNHEFEIDCFVFAEKRFCNGILGIHSVKRYGFIIDLQNKTVYEGLRYK